MKILLFIPLFIFASCTKKDFKLNEEISISFGKTVFIEISKEEKLEINFNNLIEDSRCPPNVTCFWAGQSSFTLKVNDSESLNFGIQHDVYSSISTFEDCKFTIISLKYDKEENFGQKNHGTIKLKVEKV